MGPTPRLGPCPQPVARRRCPPRRASSPRGARRAARRARLPDGFPARCSRRRRPRHPRSAPTADATAATSFVTIDRRRAIGDQALHLERRPGGRRALRDRGRPGLRAGRGAVDREARSAADPLRRRRPHPAAPARAERGSGVAPARRRPQRLLWSFELDDAGAVVRTPRRTARCARASSSATPAQARDRRRPAATRARAPPRDRARPDRAGAGRGGREPQHARRGDRVATAGGYALERRHLLPVEEWNAQLSLDDRDGGRQLMIAASVGILRTMPKPDRRARAAFRRQTVALGTRGPAVGYDEYRVGHHDVRRPRDHAGRERAVPRAGYVAMDGEVPADPVQSALAAPYAHVTAPLRGSSTAGASSCARRRAASRSALGARVAARAPVADGGVDPARAGSRPRPSRASRRACSPTASASASTRDGARGCAGTTR